MTDTKWLLYTPGGPTVTRILPELAVEIGLNESIVLMQISFWIGQSNNLRDGCYWTYQSLRQMREKAFPYWSIETIRRTIESLAKKGYIRIGNYNKIESDKTQWFTLDPEMCSRLRSVLCAPVADEGVSKCDRVSQNETGVSQNETTLPEITPEITHIEESVADKPRRNASKKRIAIGNSEKDALILAWAKSLNLKALEIGAELCTAARRKRAAEMLRWPTPVTPDEVRQFVSTRKPDYEFCFLPNDLSKERARAVPYPKVKPAQPQPEPVVIVTQTAEQIRAEVAAAKAAFLRGAL